MKNAYSLFLRIPLFTFQPPEGPFLLLSGRHRRAGCWTEGGWEWKEEPMGCLRWGGDAAVFNTAAGKCVSFV